jgi:hypothetical protein
MIMKVSSSGKQVQVIDDDGNVFGTSCFYTQRMLDEKNTNKFLLLTRLPFKVSPDRFKASPLWDPSTSSGKRELTDEELTTGNDALSVKKREEGKLKKIYTDDGVMF